MGHLGRIASIFFFCASGTSCGIFPGGEPEEVVDRSLSPVPISEASVETMGLAGARELSPEALDGRLTNNLDAGAATLLDTRVFNFAYDSSQILEKYNAAIEAHTRYLIKNPNAKVSLEGHTDERGSREYNLALGEKRAKTVAELLIINGVASDKIDTVSYGEEKPASPGSNERSWSQNRRALVKTF